MDSTDDPTSSRERRWSILRGAVAGLGLGLLSCDLLDFFRGDLTALLGWRTGLVLGPIAGGFIGHRRASRPPVPRATSPDQPDWKLIGWLLLGCAVAYEAGLGWWLADRSLPAVQTWLTIMTIGGTLYLGIPLGIAAARWW